MKITDSIDWILPLHQIHSAEFLKIRGNPSEISLENGQNVDVLNNLINLRDKYYKQVEFLHGLDSAFYSAQFSLEDYETSQTNLRSATRLEQRWNIHQRRTIHYAEVHINSMRNIAERFKWFNKNTVNLPAAISDTIKLVWRKKKPLLERYTGARDFVTHQGEQSQKNQRTQQANSNIRILNGISDNVYQGTENTELQAPISTGNFEILLEGRNEIIESISNYANSVKSSHLI